MSAGKTLLDKLKAQANGKTPPPRAAAPRRAAAPPPRLPDGPVTHAVEYDDPFPHDPRKEAYAGLVGELVDAVDPHTEASRVAVLIQALTAFGNLVGRGPYFMLEQTKHHTVLFPCLVGNTGKARKGTSWNRVLDVMGRVDEPWFRDRLAVGLSSAEGLIDEIRDPETTNEVVPNGSGPPGQRQVVLREGVDDKRLMVVETEFANVLKQAERQGNTLSILIRQAWDGTELRTMSRNKPGRCRLPHVSVIGHITAEELRRYLSATETASGFANRFLWLAIRRSKLLPLGGGHQDYTKFVEAFKRQVSFARAVGQMPFDDEASEMWCVEYVRLTADRPGLFGALCARAEPYTLRLAALYALLDGSYQIEAAHLRSGLALWDYCERSTAYLFGHSTGDVVADEIFAALKTSREGMSRNDLYLLFSRHQSREKISRALLVLTNAGLAHALEVMTQGRPKEVWQRGRAP